MIRGDGDLVSFFRELVDRATRDTGVTEETGFYLVRLLSDMRGLDEGPFGERLLSSTEPAVLRSVGDGTLFLSGFFPERLVYRGISPVYMAQVGSSAYASLSGRAPEQTRSMFKELATRFQTFQGALEDVREMCDAMGMDSGMAALRWLQTGSPAFERRLNELGMFLIRHGDSGN